MQDGDTLVIDADKLSRLTINQLVSLMSNLGLAVDDIRDRTQALTRIISRAIG